MKKLFTYILAAAMVVGTVGCDKNNPDDNSEQTNPGEGENNEGVDPPGGEEIPETLRDKICGEWHYESEDGLVDIYLSLDKDGTHELYQKFEGGVHHLFRGTWTLTDNILAGQYNDQTPWRTSYIVDLSEDKNVLTLTESSESAAAYVYFREMIPDSIRDTSIPAVRSSLPF